MLSLLDRRRAVRGCVALGCVATLASCGPFDSPPQAAKVDVDTLSTNILFGVPSAAAAATPAAPPQFTETLPLGQPSDLFFNGNSFSFPTLAPAAACPTAPTTAFPAQVATTDVTTMPGSGSYRWATGGSWVETVPVVGPITLPLPNFEQRVVRNAAPYKDPVPSAPGSPPDYAFTYQTIEPQVSGGGALLFNWRVKANANQQQVPAPPTTPPTPPTGPPAPAPPSTVSDPEAGLVLKSVATLDANGKQTGTLFDSGNGPGLLLFPLPVQPGATFNSTSADTSTSANTLKVSGTVGNHENVDACGTPIQAWAVDATLTAGNAAAATPATLHYDVATQMGALIIAFNIDGSYFGTQFSKETARIGQTTPDAVPDKYK